tara:strand:- start:45736 stop:46152 length:417 start_codon:yes stop_codon:yes gene_type:complete
METENKTVYRDAEDDTSPLTLDQVWDNLAAQHAYKMEDYIKLKGQVDDVISRPQEQGNQTFSLREIQYLRDELIKIEGGLDALNIIFTRVNGEEARNYVKEPEKTSPTVRVHKKDKVKYAKLEDWVPDPSAPKVDIGL